MSCQDHLLKELKELKSICFEIVERINLLEKVFDTQRRDWNRKMNERLEKLVRDEEEWNESNQDVP